MLHRSDAGVIDWTEDEHNEHQYHRRMLHRSNSGMIDRTEDKPAAESDDDWVEHDEQSVADAPPAGDLFVPHDSCHTNRSCSHVPHMLASHAQ